jgi:hypothetical protein
MRKGGSLRVMYPAKSDSGRLNEALRNKVDKVKRSSQAKASTLVYSSKDTRFKGSCQIQENSSKA